MGVSLALVLVLTVAIGSAQYVSGTPTPPAPENLTQPMLGNSPGYGPLDVAGALFALLPAGVGTLWLLAHGVPVGFQNAQDLSGIPMLGAALSDVPLQIALLGNWPWGAVWRLLLAGPVVGLLVGGLVAARGSSSADRWRQGALVGVFYAVVALLTALLVGATVSMTLGAAEVGTAFRASLAPLLLLLPVGAVLGAVGGLLDRRDALPVPPLRRSFVMVSVVGAAVLTLGVGSVAALGFLEGGSEGRGRAEQGRAPEQEQARAGGELEAPKEPSGSTERPEARETVEEGPEEARSPSPVRPGPQTGSGRPWWRRMFGG